MRYMILTLALALAAPISASAQEMTSIDMDYTVTKKDCPRVSTAGPAVGVSLGSASVVAGSVTLFMGLDRDMSANVQRDRGMVAAGGALIGAGAVAVAISAWRLAKQREKRAFYREGMCGQPVARRGIIPGIRF